MNIEKIASFASIIIPSAGALIWLVRLESKVITQGKRIKQLEDNRTTETQLLYRINQRLDNLVTNLRWVIKASGVEVPEGMFTVDENLK